MRPGAILINAGRGGVVHELALRHAIDTKGLRVVLDVWENEPNIDAALFSRVAIGTPHVAGYAALAKKRGAWTVWCAAADALRIPVTGLPGSLTSASAEFISAPWRDALLTVYDPRKDHQLLSERLGLPKGRGFDQMRKQYYPRREISEFTTASSTLLSFGFGA